MKRNHFSDWIKAGVVVLTASFAASAMAQGSMGGLPPRVTGNQDAQKAQEAQMKQWAERQRAQAEANKRLPPANQIQVQKAQVPAPKTPANQPKLNDKTKEAINRALGG